MGVSLSGIVTGKPIALSDLQGKVLVVDSFNMLYQFLTTIRGPDGAPLTDKHGNVTSHLVGLFSRVTKLMLAGLKLVFVFDGKAPELKKQERERRKQLKVQAQASYDQAVEAEDVDAMKKYAGRTARLTPEMVAEAKRLLVGLGLPIIEAPSEGEAQAAHMVAKGDAWGLISQDYDCLLFGTSRMIKNLSVSARKKKPGTFATVAVEPELLVLEEVLQSLETTREGLIALGMLIGTDFNIGGIKGLGPKKGLKLVREEADLATLFSGVGWDEAFPYPWQDVFALFSHMPVTDEYTLKWQGVDGAAVTRLLVDEHDFAATRVDATLEKLEKAGQDRAQKGLGDFF